MKFNEWLSKRSLIEGKRREDRMIVCQRCGHEEERPGSNSELFAGRHRCPKCGGPFDFKHAQRKHPGGMPEPEFHGRREYGRAAY